MKVFGYIVIIGIGLVVLKLMSEYDYESRKKEEIEWELVWSEDFDYEGSPKEELWTYDLGDGCPYLCGWGNREKQYYTDDPKNVYVKNGHLHIVAIKEQTGMSEYTSARVKSKKEFDIKYGKVEIRLKNPSGKGTWPAAWMLPTDQKYGGWPKSGEIDIMEHVGYHPDSIYGTVHTEKYNHLKGTHKGGHIYIPDNESAFHDYSVHWNEDIMEFYVDDKMYFSFENEKKGSESWPFDQNFHVILNLAMGGSWGGRFGMDKTLTRAEYIIDYVKVYKDNSPTKIF